MLICSLVPPNERQYAIPGDVAAPFPLVAQWFGLELMSDEVFAWAGEDVSCALYLFLLPDPMAATCCIGLAITSWFVGRAQQ